jgi:hypothetical protein
MRTQQNLNWKKATHDGWARELAQENYDITGTLKFSDGRRVGKNTASKLLGAYWYRIDKLFFGHAAKKGIGVERWVFAEYGELGDNLHFHFKAKSPTEPVFFCAIANLLWSNFDPQTASAKYNEITPTIDPVKSARYVSKGTRHFYFDELGFKASHQNSKKIDIKGFQTQAQAQRILNRFSYEEISQAMELVTAQAAQAQRKIEIRHIRADALGAQ